MLSAAPGEPQRFLQAQIRWRPLEILFWLSTLLPFVLAPSYLILASQIAITGLFALSLDLILGYAGIVSLGHAAYFGFGSYTAGLVAKWGWGEPLSGLAIAGAAARLLGYLKIGRGSCVFPSRSGMPPFTAAAPPPPGSSPSGAGASR